MWIVLSSLFPSVLFSDSFPDELTAAPLLHFCCSFMLHSYTHFLLFHLLLTKTPQTNRSDLVGWNHFPQFFAQQEQFVIWCWHRQRLVLVQKPSPGSFFSPCLSFFLFLFIALFSLSFFSLIVCFILVFWKKLPSFTNLYECAGPACTDQEWCLSICASIFQNVCLKYFSITVKSSKCLQSNSI